MRGSATIATRPRFPVTSSVAKQPPGAPASRKTRSISSAQRVVLLACLSSRALPAIMRRRRRANDLPVRKVPRHDREQRAERTKRDVASRTRRVRRLRREQRFAVLRKVLAAPTRTSSTSARACTIGFPISRTAVAASRSRSSRKRAATPCSRSARWSNDVARQPSKARAAAASFASIRSGLIGAMRSSDFAGRRVDRLDHSVRTAHGPDGPA